LQGNKYPYAPPGYGPAHYTRMPPADTDLILHEPIAIMNDHCYFGVTMLMLVGLGLQRVG